MEKIDIICVGGLKEKYLKDMCAEYAKRLSRFCKLTVKELAEYKLPDDPSDGDIARALENEAKVIIAATDAGSYKIALCIEGNEMPSEKLARSMESAAVSCGRFTFIIGSSHGMSDSVKKMCDMRLSMSKMTFPHQIARGMLLEQIYRSYMIRTGRSYHK